MPLSTNKLDELLAELRRVSLSRSDGAERNIRRVYKSLMNDLNAFIGEEYTKMSEDGTLTYAVLQKKGEYARFLEELTIQLDKMTPQVTSKISNVVNEVYKLNYDGMVEAVQSVAADKNKSLAKELAGFKGATPTVIKRAVTNPVSGLTLSDTLERHRTEIIYNIKQNVGVGLTQGDRYDTMARRISQSLDGDYQKSLRIARTETHRVRESGLNDAATSIKEKIDDGESGLIMCKTWRTMEDSRVRPQRSKRKTYNHVKMDGVTVKADEKFELPSGATCMSCGNSGVAGEDIHCRCYCSYDLLTAEEYAKATGKKAPKTEKVEKEQMNTSSFENKIEQQHIDEMQSRLSNAPQNIKDVWNNYESDIKVIDTHYKGSAHHSPYKNGICFNIDGVSKERDWKKAYSTIFHESGHNIDNVFNIKQGGYSFQYFSEKYTSKKYGVTLGEMIRQEAKTKVDTIWKALKDEAKANGLKASSVRKYDAYSKINNELRSLDKIASTDISDMWEGATKGAARGYTGHGVSYWKTTDVGIEAFAEMFDASINNPESLVQIKKHFPQAYDIFLEIIEVMLK